jgi:hypothetical protein
MWQVTWTVKATKLCNLRCRYCYEWPHLCEFITASLSLDPPSRPGRTPGTAGRASIPLRPSWGQVS